MKVLDLFSGIGGFSLGLEAAGMETVAFCEIQEFPVKVLKKNWPTIPCYEDVTKLDGNPYVGIVDVICGGFPCQDLSKCGLWRNGGIGLDGTRSGLFREIVRLVGEIRPKYVILENVAILVSNGLGRCLRSFYELGYDAEWHVIPASAVGAPHLRERVWIIAYPRCESRTFPVLTRNNVEKGFRKVSTKWRKNRKFPKVASVDISLGNKGVDKPYSHRVDDGVSDWSYRLKACGNAIVPQIAEIIGNSIMEYENARSI